MEIKASAFELRIKEGYPDFLDLPWDKPLEEWKNFSSRIIQLEKGLSRHTVVFSNYEGKIYAFKNYTLKLAKKEYNLLRKAEKLMFPSVIPVGWGNIDTSNL